MRAHGDTKVAVERIASLPGAADLVRAEGRFELLVDPISEFVALPNLGSWRLQIVDGGEAR